MKKIIQIKTIQGEIELLSGLHIGGGDAQMKIGGIDNETIKDINGDPFIPGSSLKGKMRTLLEWHLGFYTKEGKPSNQTLLDVTDDNQSENFHLAKENLLKLFGAEPTVDVNKIPHPGIITRLSFWDCKIIPNSEMATSEAKMENSINRTSGTVSKGGGGPRSMERVPVGNRFEFRLSIKFFEGDKVTEMEQLVKAGLKLLELDALGGSGSRGYGKIQFNLKGDEWDLNDANVLDVVQKDQ